MNYENIDCAMDVMPEQDEYTDFRVYDKKADLVMSHRVVMSNDAADYTKQVSDMRYDLDAGYREPYSIVEVRSVRT